jgi:hypothetical protein
VTDRPPRPPAEAAVAARPSGSAGLRRQFARVRRPFTLVHWASLGGAGLFLLWAARDQWFDSDEWNFLAQRRLVGSATHTGIWDPHNRHWTTLGVLLYRLLYSVFGVRSYVPYVVVLILAHLLVAHLLWRLLRGVGVSPLFATAAAGVFALAGAGWENLANAFQITLVGSLAAGLGAFAITRANDRSRLRVAAVWALLLVSLMFSGVGIAMVVVVAAGVLLRSGLRAAVVTASLPTVVYLVWYAVQGRDAPKGAGEQGLWPALQATPAFVWRGLTSAIDVETGLEGIAVVVLVLLAWWLVRTADLADDGWRDCLVLAFGAVLFLAVTAIGRSGLGVDTAASSRYAYVTLALLLPVATLGADRVLARSPARLVALTLAVGLVILVSVSTVAHNADVAGAREQEQKHRVLAAASLVAADDRFVDTITVPVYLPDLDVDGIRELLDAGAFPPRDVSPEDVLTARVMLQLRASDDPIDLAGVDAPPAVVRATDAELVAGASSDCVGVVPRGDHPTVELQFDQPGAMSLRSQRSGTVNAWFRDPETDVAGRSRPIAVTGGRLAHLAVSHPDLLLALEVASEGTTTLCGVQPGS